MHASSVANAYGYSVQAITVSALVNFLREIFESNEILSDLWVVGEVSNYSRPGSGHRYFTLKDSGGAIRTVLFRDTQPGMTLRDGDRVLAHGRVSVYPQRGELQFICNFIRPEGTGLLAARFEELRLRLEAEGLFAPERKRPLPAFPRRIGIVTSPTGAALQDVKNVLARRWPLAELVISPATVQGEYAVGDVVAALRALARQPGIDVAILARGGGASEDLSAFNHEGVARAIFGFPVPIVSGVGHETDTTIADLVADVRAPTPSAAAERATPSLPDLQQRLAARQRSLRAGVLVAISKGTAGVNGALRRIERNGPNPRASAHAVQTLTRVLESGVERRCAADRARYEHALPRLVALDPSATLARGFAIVRHAQGGRVISSVRAVKPGARISVAVQDGAFWAEVS